MKAIIFGVAGALLFAMLVSLSSAQADTISYSGSVVPYTVPTTGIYAITAAGAQGGQDYAMAGGLGAMISGDVILNAGVQLEIAVGGAGSTGNFGDYYSGGGGGGSFVYVQSASQPLLVAGGGGGTAYASSVPGGSGQTSVAGQAGYGADGGSAGTGGSGGGGGTDGGVFYNGGGGGGWLSAGGNGVGPGPLAANGFGSGDGGFGPSSFAGGAGVNDAGHNANGGFGGGGGGGGYGGGGGGGYSGGGGGDGDTFSGGGGGSFLDPSFTNTTLLSGANSGNGYVSIVLVMAVPEPGTLALVGSALLGLGVAYLHRRRANGRSEKGRC